MIVGRLGPTHTAFAQVAVFLVATMSTYWLLTPSSLAESSPLDISETRHVIIQNQFEDQAFAQVVFARTFEDHGAVVIFDKGGRTSERLIKAQVKDHIEVPDLGVDFLLDFQFEEVKACLEQLTTVVEAYPRLRPRLLPLGSELKTIVDAHGKNLIRQAGVWREKPESEMADAGTVLTSTSGKVYRGVEVREIEPDGLLVQHEAGVSKIAFLDLPKDVQDKYGFDPVAAEAFRKEREAALAARMQPSTGPDSGSESNARDELNVAPAGWLPTSLSEVSDYTLLASLDSDGAATGFLCNENGSSYIYTNMHNMDGTYYARFRDKNGTLYDDVEYAEVAMKPWGYWEDAERGGDLVRFKLRRSLPKALSISTQREFEPGDEVGVVGNTAGEGMNLTQGKITSFNGAILFYDTPTWGGNSGSPVVDLTDFRVIGIHTWGAKPNRPSPLDVVWKNDVRIGVGGGAGRAGAFATPPQWHRMSMEQFAEACQQQVNLIKLIRILGLMDALEPKSNGLYANPDEIIMGDWRISDVLEESKSSPLIQAILRCDAELRKNKETGIRTSNRDVYLSYLPLLSGIYEAVAQERASMVKGNQLFFYELEFNNGMVPHLCVLYERSILEAIGFYNKGLSLGGTIQLDGRPRLPKLSNVDLMQALDFKE